MGCLEGNYQKPQDFDAKGRVIPGLISLSGEFDVSHGAENISRNYLVAMLTWQLSGQLKVLDGPSYVDRKPVKIVSLAAGANDMMNGRATNWKCRGLTAKRR